MNAVLALGFIGAGTNNARCVPSSQSRFAQGGTAGLCALHPECYRHQNMQC